MPRKVEISHRTIIFTFVLVGFIWFVFLIKEIIFTLFVALLIMVILNPLVRKLSRFRIPRGPSVLIVYFFVFGVVGVSLASVIPVLLEQTGNFAQGLPSYIEHLNINSAIADQVSRQLLAQVGTLPGRIVELTVSVVSNFISVLTVLTFTFYLLLLRDKLESQLVFLFGEKKSQEIGDLIDELEVKLGGWARGQLLLMVTVGFFNYIGLTLLGVPFALPLGILAGFLEILPYIGPVIAGIPAVVIGFGISPLIGAATVALAFLVQQVENYVLVPKIMERSVGVNPVVTLLSLAIGFRIAGIVGVLVSIPVVITLRVVAKKHLLNHFAN